METNVEINNIDKYLAPILDKKIVRGDLLIFVNEYCDHIKSVPLLMEIIKNGKKESENRVKKLKELEEKIKQDIDSFENTITKILKDKGLFDINHSRYQEITKIKKVRDCYLRDPPYDFLDLEASMLYATLIEKEDWTMRHGQFRSAIIALIEDKQNDVLKMMFPKEDLSDYKDFVSPSYEIRRKISAKRDNIWTVWHEIEIDRPYFGNFTTKRLREVILMLNHLLKLNYQNSLIIEPEFEAKPLPIDVNQPKIKGNHYILEFKDGKKLEFDNQEDLSCKYFDLTLKQLGQITPYSLVCNKLGLENNAKSKKKIRDLVNTLRGKFFNNKLSNRLIYKPYERQGYILNITEELDI